MCDKCIEWDGKIWHRYKGGYYVTMVRLHREMWEKANGPIPPGFDVHHINEDKGDNRPENYELRPHRDHSVGHYERHLRPHRERALQNSMAARKQNREERLRQVLTCIVCGSEYHSGAAHPSRFCSSRCVELVRSGAFAGESRRCEYCGEPYYATKRAQRYCSDRCNARAASARVGTLTVRDVTCANCGQVFQSARANARFCSRPCALNFHGRNRFRGKVSDAR